MFIPLPQEFLLNNYINTDEKKTLNLNTSEDLEKRDFNDFTNLFFKKFNFLFLKSLNLLKKFSLKDLYENSSFIFSGIFYSHEIILLSLKPEKSNKDSINLCKILLEYMNSKDNYPTKKYKNSTKSYKTKNKKKKERIENNYDILNEDLKKSIEQIKFEYKTPLIEILDECRLLNTRDINSFYNKFIEEVIIPNIKYLCDFMNFEFNAFEDKIKAFIE